MANIEIETHIAASPERCFDLARDLDLHVDSMRHTGERAVAGRTSGLIEAGEQVTWRGRHFGVDLEHTSRITAFDRPRHFRDSMTSGWFRSFEHDHFFGATATGTVMRDVIEFSTPLGPIGRFVEAVVLRSYLRRLIIGRAHAIRDAAEAGHVRR
ncbi:MAG: SRPBCC family protein [Vicinamibacterales bacterium]